MNRTVASVVLTALVALLAVSTAEAACMNKFVAKADGPRQNVTLLSGKLTFQEAQALAASIKERKHPGLEWVDAKGKGIAKQFGELNVARPMPVGCDGRTSGVVMTVTFATAVKPSKSMLVKIDDQTTVEFEEQAN